MALKDHTSVFPVTHWKAGPLPGYHALALKLTYLTHSAAGNGTEHRSQFFAFPPEMVEALISELQKQLDALQNMDKGNSPQAKH